MARLPPQALAHVLLVPHVVRRQRVDAARVGYQVARGDLCPRPNPYAVRLRDAAVTREAPRRGLAVGPDALLERARQLRLVRLLDEVVALVVEGGIEEEPIVLDLEVAVLLADTSLAECEQLLALGKRAHGHGPFFESDWHSEGFACAGLNA